MASHIDPQTRMGAVSLSVGNLSRSLNYYQHTIGLALLSQRPGSASLGIGGRPLLHLQEIPGARLVRRATGLYHFALRVPTRRDFARVMQHFVEIGCRIDGASDHGASEALYLADPDGHGIEIGCDRSRENWFDAQGHLRAATAPLNFANLMSEIEGDDTPWTGFPAGSDMGHVHLQVADIRAAERFYVDTLGFERMAAVPGASFVSAGRYHHHLGLNTWAGTGLAAPPQDSARLLGYEVLLPSETSLHATVDRLRAAQLPITEEQEGWSVPDPSHNRVLLRHLQ